MTPRVVDFQHAFLMMGLVPLASIPVLVGLGAVYGRRKVSEAAA